MNITDSILQFIQQRGKANREAIIAHRSVEAGKKGIRMAQPVTRKSGTQGMCGPRPRFASNRGPERLPYFKVSGTPLACTGPKPDGDGYKRDRITGVITKCAISQPNT